MNCNKCGTPILPGENICRFCGAMDDFSKRMPVEPKPEIIDFNIYDEVEVVDFMIGEDDVLINSEPKEETMDLEEVMNFSFDDVSLTTDKVEEEPIIPVVNSVIEEPATARIPVEEVKEILSHDNDNKEDIIDEPAVELIFDATLDKNEEQAEQEYKPNDIVKEETVVNNENPKKEKKNSKVGLIIVTMLLIVSLILNCFLLMGRATNPDISNNDVSEVSSTTVYNNYEIKLPNNWDVNNTNDEFMLVYDGTEDWAASINFTKNSNFSLVKSKISELTDEFGNNKYLFTSDYTKTVNNKEFYVFKGKYYSYSVYIIINEVNDNTIAITDLKFVGEVEEDVLNGLLNSLTTVSVKDMSNFMKDNFEFNDNSKILNNIIKEEN